MKAAVLAFRKLQELFIGAGILIIAFVLFANVVLRYLFNSSIEWAEEFTRYGIVWITFIGASVCVYKGAHLGIDSALAFFSQKGVKVILRAVNLICLTFTLIFTILSLKITLKVWETGQLSSTLGIPMYIIYGVMPLSGILMSFSFIGRWLGVTRQKEQNLC